MKYSYFIENLEPNTLVFLKMRWLFFNDDGSLLFVFVFCENSISHYILKTIASGFSFQIII